MTTKRVVVGTFKPNEQPKRLRRFATVRAAEQFIARQVERIDPAGVAAGHYYIDAPEELLNPRPKRRRRRS